jgi:hypothetical protein
MLFLEIFSKKKKKNISSIEFSNIMLFILNRCHIDKNSFLFLHLFILKRDDFKDGNRSSIL